MKIMKKENIQRIDIEMDFDEFRKEYMENRGKYLKILWIDYPDGKDIRNDRSGIYIKLYDSQILEPAILDLRVRFVRDQKYKYPEDDPGVKDQWKEAIEWWLQSMEFIRNELIYSLDLIKRSKKPDFFNEYCDVR